MIFWGLWAFPEAGRLTNQPLTPILSKSIAIHLPIPIAILLHKCSLLWAESGTYTTNLYHDTAPICIAMLLKKY